MGIENQFCLSQEQLLEQMHSLVPELAQSCWTMLDALELKLDS